MNNKIELEQGQYGTKAILRTEWKESYFRELNDKNIKELELNDGKGWTGDNVDFLILFPNLLSLTIIDFRIKSIASIHLLKKLKEIHLSTYSNEPIDFLSFPELLECSFEWINDSDSLFAVPNLRKLFLNSFKKGNIDMLSELINLEQFSLLNSPVDNLRCLTKLVKLKELKLANLNKIISLDGIEQLDQLETLELYKCKKLFDISQIWKLKKLKNLFLLDIGNISSIKSITGLTELEKFIFYESTNISDGDLSPLFKLQNLSKVSFQNRRHYSHKREDFGKLYG